MLTVLSLQINPNLVCKLPLLGVHLGTSWKCHLDMICDASPL